MDHTPELERVLARLRAFRKEARLSYSGLALKADLSRAALLDMDARGWAPTSTTIRAIEALIPRGWQAGDPLPEPTPDRPRRRPDAEAA